jgi:hypothetical protein
MQTDFPNSLLAPYLQTKAQQRDVSVAQALTKHYAGFSNSHIHIHSSLLHLSGHTPRARKWASERYW